ncbi:MAG: single-stranded DNA-binding protein [Phycisphaeraceae bacterium]|jgi:single-strand DNA-binding protein|nr:single-stranded DNA-binding protein [Phycisphaeraceae bacterium]
MPNYNKVLLMGNLTRDPELRFTANNQAVANLGLAVNRRWRSNEGEQREETTFVDCEAWGRTAEVMNQYLKKGRPVFVEGRLKLDQWQDKEGNNRSKMKVVIDSFQFIDGQGGDDNGGSAGTARTPQAAPVQAGGSPPDGPHEAIESDDIPF